MSTAHRNAILFLLLCVSGDARSAAAQSNATSPPQTGSVIFIHPDGTSAAHWHAARLAQAGPDGELNWDKLARMAVYTGHLANSLSSSSNGGAVAHAYGVKPRYDSFGLVDGAPLTSASGKSLTIMEEAAQRGLSIGLINSASITDAGTGAFLARAQSRKPHEQIAAQMLAAGPAVLLGGGEQWFLPETAQGRHGSGRRKDGQNLIEAARKAGYYIVYTAAELGSVPAGTQKLLGLFAADDTFNDEDEETLRKRGLPPYQPSAPTFDQMLSAALPILAANGRGFLLVAEEEGTDNFPGANNAYGTLEALRRADVAIGVARAFVEANPRTLLLTAADSSAGGMEVLGLPDYFDTPDKPLPKRHDENALLDGRDGTGTPPFLAAADRSGKRLPFGIVWTGDDDVGGGVIARAHGFNADLLTSKIDNTGIYTLMYRTLFGTPPQPR